jgi:hypothetical protein
VVTGEASVEVREYEGRLRGAVGCSEGILEEGLLLDPWSGWFDVQAQYVEAVALELHDEPESSTMKQNLRDE